MYKVTDNLIPLACGQESRDIKVKVEIVKEVFDDSHIIDFLFEGSVITNEDIELGGCVASRFNVKLRTNKAIYKQSKVVVSVSVQNQLDESITTGYIPMGEFYVDDITVVKIPGSDMNIVTINCFDKFATMNRKYNSSVSYPTTARHVLDDISTQLSLPLYEPSLNLLNQAFYIKDKIENVVYRDVLRWIASMNGGFFVINREGKLQFRVYEKAPTSEKVKLREGKFFELPKTGDSHKIIKKLVYNQDTELEAIGIGPPVSIEETLFAYNPLVNTAQAEKAYAAVQGVHYKPMTVSCPGNVLLDVGDTVQVVGEVGTEERIIVLRHTLSYKGGLKSVIESPTSSTPVIEQKSIGLSNDIKDLNQRLGIFLQHINPEKIKVTNQLKQVASIPIKTRNRTDLKFSNTLIVIASDACEGELVIESEGNVVRHPWPLPLNKGLNLVAFSTTQKDLPTIQGYINYKMSSGAKAGVTLEIEEGKAEFTIYGGSIIAGSEAPVLDFRDTLEISFSVALSDSVTTRLPMDHKRNENDTLKNLIIPVGITDNPNIEIQLVKKE